MDYTFGEWVEKYKPVCDDDGEPVMFETYGVDWDMVCDADINCVWTLCDGMSDEGLYIVSGRKWVNRINYYITEIPVGEDEVIFVEYPSEEEE